MDKEEKKNIIENILLEKGIELWDPKSGRMYSEIATAMIDNLEGINISRVKQEDLVSMTDKVITGLTETVDWNDHVGEILKGTIEYQTAEETEEDEEDEEDEEEVILSVHEDEYKLDDEDNDDDDEEDQNDRDDGDNDRYDL